MPACEAVLPEGPSAVGGLAIWLAQPLVSATATTTVKANGAARIRPESRERTGLTAALPRTEFADKPSLGGS